MGEKMIDVGKDFAPLPGGRVGNNSGQLFREKFLVPALKNNEKVIVDLDNTLGLGSSFLEESFGGLVREDGFKASDLKKRLEIRISVKSYIDEIWSYINSARRA